MNKPAIAQLINYPEGIVILSGLPGSGKSHLAAELCAHYHSTAAVVSADQYWAEDYSDFEAARLPQAHNYCLQQFLHHTMVLKTTLIIVDNTNLRALEVAPYYQLAQALGYRPVIIRVRAPVRLCLERQQHDVPEDLIGHMANRVFDVPPWWAVEHYNNYTEAEEELWEQ